MLEIYNNNLFNIEKKENDENCLIIRSTIYNIKDILLNFYDENDLSYQPTTYERLNIINRAIISDELNIPILNWDIVIDKEYKNILEITKICKLTKIIIQLINSLNIMNSNFSALIYCHYEILGKYNIKKYRLENILEQKDNDYIFNIRIYNLVYNALDESKFLINLNLEEYQKVLQCELEKYFSSYKLETFDNTKEFRKELIQYLNNISNNETLKNIVANNRNIESVKKILCYILSVFVNNKTYKSSILQLFDGDLNNILLSNDDYLNMLQLVKKKMDKNKTNLKWYNAEIKQFFYDYMRKEKPSLKVSVLDKILSVIGQVEYDNNLDLCYFTEKEYLQLFELVNNEKYYFIYNTKIIIDYYINWYSSNYNNDNIKRLYSSIDIDKISNQKNTYDIIYSYDDFNNLLNYLYNTCAKSLRDKQCVVFQIFNSFKYCIADKEKLSTITVENYKDIITHGLSFRYLNQDYCLNEILENSLTLCEKLIFDTKKDNDTETTDLLFASIKGGYIYPTTIKNFINKSIPIINNSQLLKYSINSNTFIQKQLSTTLSCFKLLKLSETGQDINNKEILLDILLYNPKSKNIIDNTINNNNKKVIVTKIDSYIDDFLKRRKKFI